MAIIIVVLENAKRVHPQITVPKALRDFYGV
jgi:hypothetical protein